MKKLIALVRELRFLALFIFMFVVLAWGLSFVMHPLAAILLSGMITILIEVSVILDES